MAILCFSLLYEFNTSQIRAWNFKAPCKEVVTDFKGRISDYDADNALVAFVDGLQLNPKKYIIGRSSIKRARENFEKETAKTSKM